MIKEYRSWHSGAALHRYSLEMAASWSNGQACGWVSKLMAIAIRKGGGR